MEERLSRKYNKIFPILNENQRRMVAASDAEFIGRGGTSIVSKASGLSRSTISIGKKELQSGFVKGNSRIRKEGGGRKELRAKDATLEKDLEWLVSPATRGDPESPLLWCSKSLRNIAEVLQLKGHKISHNAVGSILRAKGYSLQSNRKTHEGGEHPDGDKQFPRLLFK